MKRYLETVGRGGTMNLGIAPMRDGVLAPEDVRALAGFKALKDAFFAKEVTAPGEPFNVVVLTEDLSAGEQIDHWYLWGDKNESGRRAYICGGRAVGNCRIKILDGEVAPRELVFDVKSSGADPRPVKIRRYKVDAELLKLIQESTTDSGETDTARWMTGIR